MGEWVLKTPLLGQPPGMFASELHGLNRLKSAGCQTPKVQFESELGLVMAFYPPTSPTDGEYAHFGTQLAQLHGTKHPHYGDDGNAFLASLPLPNIPADTSWDTAFVELRLGEMYRRAVLKDQQLRTIDLARLDGVSLPQEGPCLIHGDLWQGNIHPTQNGLMMLDPSCWVGERALDIAMLRLFGSLPEIFWQSYRETYPIPSAVESVIPLYQLYYALGHVALFGQGYSGLCRQLWRDFVGGIT